MTMPDERYRAVTWARQLLEDLTVPSITPKIPSYIRDRARTALRHFPQETHMDAASEASPDVFSKNLRLPSVPQKTGWWWWK
jgi:hypothetical protein